MHEIPDDVDTLNAGAKQKSSGGCGCGGHGNGHGHRHGGHGHGHHRAVMRESQSVPQDVSQGRRQLGLRGI
ncbi:MAG: hypothetical protein PUK40_01040 [Actinomycetaceae bacterium]|nr:hypothetical protein [Arcanobacterium sp.]MDD7504526.1 hypothetical protein [Actinomycetaceae bacterium]